MVVNVQMWKKEYVQKKKKKKDANLNIFINLDIVANVIKLQKELGVPIAYHVYNWHEIPFNIEYPHFLPAKDEFIKGAERLRDYPVYILPYINAGSWEMHDAEMGHKVNFENVGKYAAAVKEDGSFDIENYPQVTLKGETSLLAHLCPSSDLWHNVMKDLVKEMESDSEDEYLWI